MKKVPARKSTLTRDINPMPKKIQAVLIGQGLLILYNARPAYQRNDYLGWISRAKLEATKEKRINQMFTELKQGDRYMRMRWNPK
jgi:uncharacterized protein YdeI (YjbR/CyaY-like superfamily)